MGILDSEICFVTCADQDIYVGQFLRKYNKFRNQYGHGLMCYVSTNLPDKIKSDKNLKIFSLRDLQERDPITIKHEELKRHIEYGYYRYPWNSKRHIINRAFSDGYRYVIWTECDTHFTGDISLLKNLLDKIPINSILTSCTIWRYNNQPDYRIFSDYEKICKKLKLKIDLDYFAGHDGANAIYFLDKNKQNEFIKNWDALTIHGYTRYSIRPRNGWIENMALVLGCCKIKIIPISNNIFTIRHELDPNKTNKYLGYNR